jgi:hypothetical protein
MRTWAALASVVEEVMGCHVGQMLLVLLGFRGQPGGELVAFGNDGDTVRSVLLSKHFVRRGEPMRGEISSSLAPVFAR